MGVADSAGDDAHWESGISWRRMFAVFWRIGILSFGGPAAQIALMHRVLVEEEKWLDEPRFLGALSFCMLLPGPEAMQLATYAGWQLRGVPGGLLAGLLFVVPGALVVLGLAALYMTVGHLPVMAALFLGDQGCGSHHRAGGFAEGVEESAAFRRALDHRRPGLRGHLLSVGPVPRPYPGSRPGRIFPVGRPKRRKDRDRAGWRFDVRHFEDGSDMDGCLVDAGAVADGSGRLRHSGADRQFLLPPRGGHVRRRPTRCSPTWRRTW